MALSHGIMTFTLILSVHKQHISNYLGTFFICISAKCLAVNTKATKRTFPIKKKLVSHLPFKFDQNGSW